MRDIDNQDQPRQSLYCHDNEHSRSLDAEWLSTENPDKEDGPTTTHSPFANLKDLLRKPS